MRLMAAVLLAGLAHCQPDETLTGHGALDRVWLLRAIEDTPIASPAEVRFQKRGVMDGRGPCNAFRARISVPYPWFALDGFEAGDRDCPDHDTETRMIAAFAAATLVEIAGDTMLLTDDDGTVILRFTAE